MSFSTITNSIRGDFKTRVEDGLPVLTQYDNMNIPDAEEVLWIRMTIIPNTSSQVTLGATARFRNPGIMIVQIFNPVAKGEGAAYAMADSIADLYRAATVSGVRFQTPSVRRVGNTESWWQLNLEIPFYKDDTN